ncbi:MAG: hypothetical protein KKC19_02450 [Nanoarchaeota archaeon]|nr:hypothetical protein [Nanoarchaeota archaeon]
MKKILVGFLAALFALQFVSADVIMPSMTTLIGALLSLFLGVIILETILFWLLSNKAFSIQCGFWKSLIIVGVANIVTTGIGFF